MKTITETDFHQHINEYLKLAQSEAIIIRLAGGSMLWLSWAESEDLADEIIERDPRFSQIIAERQMHYRQHGGVSLNSVRDSLIEELTEELQDTNPRVREDAAQYLIALKGSSDSSQDDKK